MRADAPARRQAGGTLLSTGGLPGRRIGLLIAALMLSLFSGYLGYQRYLAPTQVVLTYQTATTSVGSLVSSITATGNVVTVRQAKLGFAASGRLQEMKVSVGDSVTAGQELARLDVQALQIKFDQADANLKTAQIKLQQLEEGATAEDVAAARASYDAAMAKYNDVAGGATDADIQAARSAVDQANATIASSQAKLDQVTAGPLQADLVSAQSAVDQAKANVVTAEAKLDQLTNATYTQADWANAFAAVDSARADLTSAKSKLEQVKTGSLPADIAAQQATVAQASSNLTEAQDRLEMWKSGDTKVTGATSNSQVVEAVNSAQVSYEAAVAKLNQMMGGPLPADLQTAVTAVDKAQASYSAAAAKVELMKQGAQATDVATAQASLDSSKAALASAQAKLDQLQAGPQQADVVAAQSSVDTAQAQLSSAQAKLAELNRGPKAADVQAARSALVTAQAELATKANPPKETDVALAEQQIRLAQSSLDQARLDMANGVLVAPFDGVVSAVSANPGEQVSAGPIVTLLDPKQVRIDVSVDESDVAKLSLGQIATVTFDAMAGTQLRGRVVALSPAGTSQQGVVSYLASIGTDNPPKLLPSGMTATVSIETERKNNVVLVPLRAVRTQGQVRTVEVLPPGKDAQPETRQVRIGSTNDQFAEVISGLGANEQVVIPTTSTSQPRTGFGPGTGAPGGGFGGPGGTVVRPPAR